MFGNNTYSWRIRCRSNLGHIFRWKKCILWARRYGTLIEMCLVNSIKVNICLVLLYWELPDTRKCHTACHYCSRICNYEGSGKPGEQMNGTHCLLVSVGDVNILNYNFRSMKESTVALLPVIKILLCKRIQRKLSHCSSFNASMQNKSWYKDSW
jgi:hypothetical protein